MPGDELVRFRLECSTGMYEQSTDNSIKQGLSRFEHDLQMIFIRLLCGSKYGLVRSVTALYD